MKKPDKDLQFSTIESTLTIRREFPYNNVENF